LQIQLLQLPETTNPMAQWLEFEPEWLDFEPLHRPSQEW